MSSRDEPHHVFLCHTNADKPLARELGELLRRRGLRVWLDERELVPGREWQEGIERAVSTVRSVAVLYGPDGLGAWATAEMRAFLEESFQRELPVIPVLLPGAPAVTDLPLFLRQRTWVDLREGMTEEGLTRLVWGITSEKVASSVHGEVAQPGRLWNVPTLPLSYKARKELDELRVALTSPDPRPVALVGRYAPMAVQGMGGVGKTVLAASLAHDPDVRRAFPDGIFWLTLGRTPNSTLLMQSGLLAAAGSATTLRSVDEGREALRARFAASATLLVLDDVWQITDTRPFDVLGERGRLLLTTRKREVAHALSADLHAIDELADAEALEVLAKYAGIQSDPLPPEALDIVHECGGLPLALAMIGTRLRGNPPDRWASALARLRAADLDKLRAELPDYPHPSLLAAMETSVEDLPAPLQPRYFDLAVFPEDSAIPEAALATYWTSEGLAEADTQDAVDTFVSRSLVRRDAAGSILLHDLQYDFVRCRTAARRAELEARLLSAYRRLTPAGWFGGPNDGYFFQNIARHLASAEGSAGLRALLLDWRWLSSKLLAMGPNAVLADFELVDLAGDETVRLVRDAIRLSTHVIEKRPREFAGQLLGRLLKLESREIQEFCERVAREAVRPALLPTCGRLDSPGGALIWTIEGHFSWVNVLVIDAKGATMLSGSHDNTMQHWELSTGRLLRTFEARSGGISAVAFAPDDETALSWSFIGVVGLWQLSTGKLLRKFEQLDAAVNAVAVAPDRKTALSAADNHMIRHWELSTGKLLRTFKGHQRGVKAVAFAADCNTVLSGSSDHTVRQWELSTGKLLRTFEGHSDWVTSVAIAPDGKTVLSGSRDGTVKQWELATGKLLRSLEGHRGIVTALAIAPDGETALSASHDLTVKQWDLATGTLVRTLEGHSQWVTAVAYAPDGTTAVSGGYDGTIKHWNLGSHEPPHAVERSEDRVIAVAIASDGRTALSGSSDGIMKQWEVATGKLLRLFERKGEWLDKLAIAPDGKTALSSSGRTIECWELATGRLLHTFKEHHQRVIAVSIASDGKTVLSSSGDGLIKQWELATGKLLRAFEGRSSWAQLLAIAPDGKTFLRSNERDVTLLELETGTPLQALEAPGGWAGKLEIGPDSNTALLLGKYGTTAIGHWELATGKLLHTLEGHTDYVAAAAIARDEKTALSASSDCTVRKWDLATGRELASFSADAPVWTIAVTPDGGRAVAGDVVGRVHFLDTSTAGHGSAQASDRRRSRQARTRPKSK
jgi:WD40 repeat protein